MAVAKQLSVMAENKRGALAEICTKLAEKAVNISALLVPDQMGVAPLRLVVNNLETAKKVFEGLGLKYTEEDVLTVTVSDRPGALGKLTRKLADNNIDVTYAYGTILKGSEKAMIVLALSDLTSAAKVMK